MLFLLAFTLLKLVELAHANETVLYHCLNLVWEIREFVGIDLE